MDTPEQAEIRAAVQHRAEAVGYRATAREIGMSPMGVRNFLEGAVAQPKTWAKLRSWYVREGAGAGEAQSEAATVALEAFLHCIPPTLRGDAEREIIARVARLYAEAGEGAPGWLVSLEGALNAYEAALEHVRRRFATVLPIRGDAFGLDDPPFEGEPRDVAEAIARERGAWQGETFIPPHRIDRVRLGGE